MEPLTGITATALATVVTTKAIEKVGGNIGEALCKKTTEFLSILKNKLPHAAEQIEQTNEQSFDYQTVLPEIVNLAQGDPQLLQLLNELANLSQSNSLPGNFTQNIAKANQAAQTINNTFNAPVTFN